jgi:hypothetical protein
MRKVRDKSSKITNGMYYRKMNMGDSPRLKPKYG